MYWKLSHSNDLSKTTCVPNKTEYLNINAFNLIKGTYESKILTKHGSGECDNMWLKSKVK